MRNNYKLLFTNRAHREFKKLDRDEQIQIFDAIEVLKQNPHPNNSKQLKGDLSDYRRLRTGDYRVIYQVKDNELEIVVVRLGNRRDIYD